MFDQPKPSEKTTKFTDFIVRRILNLDVTVLHIDSRYIINKYKSLKCKIIIV